MMEIPEKKKEKYSVVNMNGETYDRQEEYSLLNENGENPDDQK